MCNCVNSKIDWIHEDGVHSVLKTDKESIVQPTLMYYGQSRLLPLPMVAATMTKTLGTPLWAVGCAQMLAPVLVHLAL